MTYLIRTEGLTRTYHLGGRAIHALKGIDLEIPAGKIVVMRGRSGSGKTTLLNCISGLDKPTEGKVWLDGDEITRYSERQKVRLKRQKLGFIFQAHALLPTYSAAENIDLVLRLAGWGWDDRKARVHEVLDWVGLDGWADHRPFEMSGGQQQRVAIARALAHQPKIILADEPTGELDAETSHQILQLFRYIAENQGTTIFVATHDLMVDHYADRILHLADGQLREEVEGGKAAAA